TQVDAHNIVPVWVASEKMEIMARTIRPKIHARSDLLNAEFPSLEPNPVGTTLAEATDWPAARDGLDLDDSVPGTG
ncbi:unnamed protein product, partial [Discosporangium mesarthrocarpum]